MFIDDQDEAIERDDADDIAEEKELLRLAWTDGGEAGDRARAELAKRKVRKK